MFAQWYLLWLNPEPWAVGDAFVGKKGGKNFARLSPNPNLVTFQAAVHEELEDVEPLEHGGYRLTFYLWRDLTGYISAADRVVRQHQADATNMQKALEDALQGVLFDNDRYVRDIRTVIVQQGMNIEGRILIRAEVDSDSTYSILKELEDVALAKQAISGERAGAHPSANVWPPR
jgi:hypothetical protein